VKAGGDLAALAGVCKALIEADRAGRSHGRAAVLDHDFIAAHAHGFDAFADWLHRQDWDKLERSSGLQRAAMEATAATYAECRSAIGIYGMGLTQHRAGVETVQMLVNLLLLRGNIGRSGAGICPVRGHSNVQGDRTMGIWERPKKEFLDKLQEVFGFDPPRKFGYDTVEAIRAMHAGQAKVFFALGGNFLSATPDTEFTAAALRRCALTVQVSTKLNRGHLVTGRQAVILPCLGRSERDLQASGPQLVSCENSMGVVQSSQGNQEPASEHLLSEPAIIARLGLAVLHDPGGVPWQQLIENYDRIRDLIARVVPGFDQYNERVRKPGGFYLPNDPRQGRFPTKSGKANFTVHPLPENHLEPGQLVMTTIRSHDQFNTTIYGLEDRYRGIHNERRVVFMNADDIRELGFSAGQAVDLTSYFRGQTRVARHFLVVPYDIPRCCAATYFPETNVLVPLDSVAEMSNTPTSKYVVIRVTPCVM